MVVILYLNHQAQMSDLSKLEKLLMNAPKLSPLRFNFGFLLEADLGTSRDIKLDYPTIWIAEDVRLSPLQGIFRATRTSKGIYISGLLQSKIQTNCARCLTDILCPITIELDDLFHYRMAAPIGEFQINETGILDLAPLVRELSLLAVPMQPLCKADCQGLCVNCGQNLNEADCGCQEEEIDPRLTVLQSLIKGYEA